MAEECVCFCQPFVAGDLKGCFLFYILELERLHKHKAMHDLQFFLDGEMQVKCVLSQPNVIHPGGSAGGCEPQRHRVYDANKQGSLRYSWVACFSFPITLSYLLLMLKHSLISSLFALRYYTLPARRNAGHDTAYDGHVVFGWKFTCGSLLESSNN
jgi:hypothetical protein